MFDKLIPSSSSELLQTARINIFAFLLQSYTNQIESYFVYPQFNLTEQLMEKSWGFFFRNSLKIFSEYDSTIM